MELLGKQFGLSSAFGAGVVVVLALLFLLVFLFLLGAMLRTKIGTWVHGKLEQKLLTQLPGYTILSSVLRGFVETNDSYQPAKIYLQSEAVAVLGFVMEENSDDTLTVFIPSTPAITIGNIYIVSPDRVTLLSANHLDLLNCIADWGSGTAKVLNVK